MADSENSPVRMLFQTLALGACLLELVSCAASAPKPQACDPSPYPTQTYPTEEQEICLGTAAAPKLTAFYGGAYNHGRLQSYVTGVANRIARVTEQPNTSYSVTILDTPIVNAFALPGNYIYVTRGMLALINDEAELAAVLAHEIAHLVADHSIQRRRAAMSASVLGGLVDASSANKDAVLARSQGQFADYTRDQEFDADRRALRYLLDAGYDPMAVPAILYDMEGDKRLEDMTRSKSSASPRAGWLETHPATPARVKAARETAMRMAPGGGRGERNISAYLQAIDGVVYGHSPEQGVVLGRRFVHSGLRFSFSAPEGFGIANLPGAVSLDGPRGIFARFQMHRFAEMGEGASMATEDYIRDRWASNAALSNIRHFSVSDIPSVSADARMEGYELRFVALRVSPDVVYRFLLASKTREGLGALDGMVRSFHIISAREANEIGTSRIRIATVSPHDTSNSLASRMQVRDLRVERFRVLNGLAADERLSPGQKVKLIETID